MIAPVYPALRVFPPLVLAAFATLFLAYLMQSLIRAQPVELSAVLPSVSVDFVRLPEEPPLPPPQVLKPPPPVLKPPDRAALPKDGTGKGDWVSEPFTVDPRPKRFGPSTGHADGDLMTIVAIAPEYPRRAKSRGVEGYVTLRFSVDARGRVMNPEVVDAKPPGVFEQAALSAIKRFRYRPKVVNGEALIVHGELARLRFELDD